MGLHVAGQLGRGLAVHAAQLAQDAVSPRGLEPVVLHRVDAQVCCCGEAYGGGVGMGGWGQPGGDPRDRAVLLGGGHPPHMALSSSHPSLVGWGQLLQRNGSLSLSLGTGLNGAHFSILNIYRDLPPYDRTLLPNFLKG